MVSLDSNSLYKEAVTTGGKQKNICKLEVLRLFLVLTCAVLDVGRVRCETVTCYYGRHDTDDTAAVTTSHRALELPATSCQLQSSSSSVLATPRTD